MAMMTVASLQNFRIGEIFSRSCPWRRADPPFEEYPPPPTLLLLID